MNENPFLLDLNFYKTPKTKCPYLPQKKEELIFTHLNSLHPDLTHDLMAKSGFRRSHGILYKPNCENCSECIPIRINAKKFVLSKNFKRIINKNNDLNSSEVDLLGTPEHFDLFNKYQRKRHSSGNMSLMLFEDYKSMIEDSPVDTVLFEYRKKNNNQLYAVALTDKLLDGYSMVYTFFDPDEKRRSLGTYLVIDHINKTNKNSFSYLYLGYFIKDCEKMAYKKKFKPSEFLENKEWHTKE